MVNAISPRPTSIERYAHGIVDAVVHDVMLSIYWYSMPKVQWPWIMFTFVGQSRYHNIDAYTSCRMCLGLWGWCFLLDNVTCQKCTNSLMILHVGQWNVTKTIAQTPWTMGACLVRYCIPFVDVASLKRTCRYRGVLSMADAACCWLTSLSQNAQALDNNSCHYVDVAQSMHTRHILCVHALHDNAIHCLTSLDRCTQTKSYVWRLWLVLHTIGGHLLADIRRPWPMSPNQYAHVMTNVCTTWLMVQEIGRYRLSNALGARPISSSQCTHATSDVCRPWVFLTPIGLCRLENLCRPRAIFPGQSVRRQLKVSKSICTKHGWCMQELANASPS